MQKHKSINSKQLEKELGTGSVSPVYLFLGPEEGEKEKAVKKISAAVAPSGKDDEVAYARFHIENGEFMQAVDFAATQSMFSSRKICVMSAIDTLPSNNSSLTSLFTELVATLPDTTTLILTAAENRPPKIMSSVSAETYTTVQFWHPFDSDIRQYIIKKLKDHAISIDPQALQLMMRCTGNDMRKVDNAISKIVDSGETIIADYFIKNIIAFERDITIFEFIDALFEKKPASFSLFKRLQEEGIHELVILTMITRQAESIEQFHSLCTTLPTDTVLRELKISDKKTDAFLSFTKKYPREKLPGIFHALYMCESSLKGGQLSKKFIANPIVTLISDMIF